MAGCCGACYVAVLVVAIQHATTTAPPAGEAATILCGSTACRRDGRLFCFGTARLGLIFDRQTLALVNVSSCSSDGRRSQGFLPALSNGTVGYGLWQVEYTGCHSPMGLPKQHRVELDALGSACANTSLSVQEYGQLRVLTLQWIGIAAPHPYDSQFNVTVNISVRAGSARAALRGSVHKPTIGLCVQTMALPNLERIWLRPQHGEQLFVPWFFGHAGDLSDLGNVGCGGGDCSLDIRQMSLFGTELPLQPSGAERTMQFGSVWSAATVLPGAQDQPLGLYFGSHSPRADLMLLLMSGQYPAKPGVRPPPICPYPPCLQSGEAAVRWLHLAEDLLDGSLAPFEMSYDVIIAGFEGDWYDSALIYREWALTSASWCQQGNLTARATAADSAYPTWLFRTPLWALTPAPPPMLSVNDSWLQGLVSLKNVLELEELATHLYNWESEMFDTHYPQYTAKHGFGSVVEKLERARIHTVPYINGRLMDPTLHSYSTEGASHACLNFHGAPYTEKYENDEAHKDGLVVMDPASAWWQQAIASAAGSISTTYNTSGIYIDQIAAMYAEPCYRDPLQAHTSWSGHNGTGGGGSRWADGYRTLLDAASAAVGKRRAVFSESNGEAYMGSLHGYMSVYGLRACGFVPGFQAVYSGWHVGIGTFGWPKNDHVSVRNILAHQFVYGQAMGWTSAETLLEFCSSSAANRDFLRLLTQLKVKYGQFLTLGRMLRPPLLSSATGGALPQTKLCTTDFATKLPCCNCTTVLASLWQSSGGELALALTNTAEVTVNFNVTMRLDIGKATVASVVVGDGDTKVVAQPQLQPNTFSLACTLPPTSAAILSVVAMETRAARDVVSLVVSPWRK
eukprot:COSAG05_NODE_457_length_9624_cov_14.129554_2_plen_852_part_00